MNSRENLLTAIGHLKRLEIFSKGGGFVFNTVHNILSDVPSENVVTLFDAAAEFNGRARASREDLQ